MYNYNNDVVYNKYIHYKLARCKLGKIYIVEDDENIKELLLYALTSNGFDTVGFESGSCFWESLEQEVPELILLDVMLPNESGTQILKKLRKDENTKDVPVIMLTAKSGEMDKVKAFGYGADDYITKPFSVLELVARIKAILKRVDNGKANEISYKEITVIPEKRVAKVSGTPINLTFKEFELLTYLLKNKDVVLSRSQILENVWGQEFEGESRTVDMHVKTLRKKLGDADFYIRTIRSVGYMLGE